MLRFEEIKGESFKHVAVYAEEKYGDGCKWTSGMTTGEVGKHGESIEVKTDSPLVENDKGYFHKEDIADPEDKLLD
jgi:hypothetical protein